MTSSQSLTGRRILVTGGHQPYGGALLDALREAGAQTAVPSWTDTSVDAVRSAVEAGVARLGGLDAVVHAYLAPELLAPRPLRSISEADWTRDSEGCLELALCVIQACHPHLRERGGRVVLVTPSLSTAGGAGYVPLATAAESVRLLGKAAAKQWGRDGITVNCLAPGLDALVDAGAGEGAPRIPPGEPVLPAYDPRRDVAGPVCFLASEAAGGLTAATLRVDGGVWTAG